MTKIMQLLPIACETTSANVIESIRKTLTEPLRVRSNEAKTYCAILSNLLLTDVRTRPYPELQALGFWLRPASIDSMMRQYLEVPENSYRVPCGVVFQLPPGNVATLFGYTSAIALLCGNVAIIRLPSAENPVQVILTALIDQTLQQSTSTLRERIIVLRYDHNDTTTSEISSVSDARLIWGTNKTVEHVRRLPLPPLSKHISFGDRFSTLAIKAEAYASLDESTRSGVVKNIFNDIYLFDQMACSSPRLLVWIGASDAVQVAADDFYPRLSTHASSRMYHLDVSGTLAKLSASFLALHDLCPNSYKTYGTALSVITLSELKRMSAFKEVNYGYGLLLGTRLDKLNDLVPYVERCDQTLSTWGLDKNELDQFVEECQGRGYDRIVPVGQALSFDPIWDGYNLFDVMSRLVQVKT